MLEENEYLYKNDSDDEENQEIIKRNNEDESENEEQENNEESGFSLELGDIIEIISPTNSNYHQQTYYISYINPTRIELINVSTYQIEKLNINEYGTISDESITEINILNRSDEKGYSRQKGLLPKTWIDIHFGGEIPYIITGEISNLEEDEIEITTFPEGEVIFIDFEYQGIPEDIPIDKIVIRDPPKEHKLKLAESYQLSETGDALDEVASITYTETGESIISIPDSVTPDENVRDVLQSIYLNANELFGEDLEDIFQDIELPESEKRYGIDTQVNDFTDELLSTIPNSKRSTIVMNRIHLLVERFKQLRKMYSNFDENGNVSGKKIYNDFYKPLVDRLLNLDTKLQWIIPVVTQRKKIYNILTNDSDYVNMSFDSDINTQYSIYSDYYNNNLIGDELKYDSMHTRTHQLQTPFVTPLKQDYFLEFNKEIKTDIEAIVNNLDDFYSTVSENSIETKKYAPQISKFKYLVQRYNLGMSKVKSIEYKNNQKTFIRTQLTPNDKITIKSLIFMPESVMKYSHVNLPGTNILQSSLLSQHSYDLFRIFNKKREITQKTINNLDNEIDYENISDQEKVDFLSDITEFLLDESLDNEEDKYRKFLNVIIPKIRTLIRLIKKHVKDKLSFIDVVKSLEPFLIYPENITYGQYNEIRFFIKEQIKDFKTDISKKYNEFILLLNTDYRVKLNYNRINNLLFDKKEFHDEFIQNYKKTSEEKDKDKKFISSSEELFNIIKTDQCSLFTNLITFMLLSLITPNKLLESIQESDINLLDEEKFKKNDCTQRFLTKKYSSFSEMQKDNTADDLYYDKEYDDTPYHILKKYEEEKLNKQVVLNSLLFLPYF